MAQPKFELSDWLLIKQCIESATFAGTSVRYAAGLLDKVDYMIDSTKG